MCGAGIIGARAHAAWGGRTPGAPKKQWAVVRSTSFRTILPHLIQAPRRTNPFAKTVKVFQKESTGGVSIRRRRHETPHALLASAHRQVCGRTVLTPNRCLASMKPPPCSLDQTALIKIVNSCASPLQEDDRICWNQNGYKRQAHICISPSPYFCCMYLQNTLWSKE